VYLAPLDDDQNKFWLCVSNNQRNGLLGEFVAVRLTSRVRVLPTWVQLNPTLDGFTGYVNCDDIGPIYRDQVISDAGALSAGTMRKVERALMIVLGLPLA
jgi:mRNA-degrading endonuclease toxin of MazEF toxin-antitoxin module